MEENPIEEVKTKKINTAMAELKLSLGKRFDSQQGLDSQIEKLISELDAWQKGGLVFDKEEIIRKVKEGARIKEKEAFVDYFLEVLKPLVILRVTQARFFSRIEREKTINDKDNIKLSEVLYIEARDLNTENDNIYFHLSSADDFMTKDKITDFKLELEKGLTKLAELIKQYPNIKKIWASSWIVAIPRSRKRLENFGFTFAGMISEEEGREYFPNAARPIAKAFITREELLSRYSKT